MTKGVRGQKSLKIDVVFYERPLTENFVLVVEEEIFTNNSNDVGKNDEKYPKIKRWRKKYQIRYN